ncbi:MAG: deaminase, partial [Acholeplasmatales bacterium]|nr:deaminase [Acholeplasmatales bacterium]
MKKHEKYMLEALKEAKKAYLLDEVPIGCVIVKDNKIIARAHNKRENKESTLAHAELLA